MRLAVVLVALLGAAPAHAALTAAELATVELALAVGARLPPDLPLVDASGRATTPAQAQAGRPAVLLLVDYTCTTLCGTALGMVAASLDAAGRQTLLVLGLDARDGPADAAVLQAAHPDAAAARFLTGDAASLAAAQAALGYTARYDAAADQFAHPLGALVLRADGGVSRVLGWADLDAATLRLALVEASSGTVGTIGERLRLLCYGFDAARGVYGPLIKRLMTGGTILTVLGLAGFLVLLSRQRARRA